MDFCCRPSLLPLNTKQIEILWRKAPFFNRQRANTIRITDPSIRNKTMLLRWKDAHLSDQITWWVTTMFKIHNCSTKSIQYVRRKSYTIWTNTFLHSLTLLKVLRIWMGIRNQDWTTYCSSLLYLVFSEQIFNGKKVRGGCGNTSLQSLMHEILYGRAGLCNLVWSRLVWRIHHAFTKSHAYT